MVVVLGFGGDFGIMYNRGWSLTMLDGGKVGFEAPRGREYWRGIYVDYWR